VRERFPLLYLLRRIGIVLSSKHCTDLIELLKLPLVTALLGLGPLGPETSIAMDEAAVVKFSKFVMRTKGKWRRVPENDV
jgi:hypothetical protein